VKAGALRTLRGPYLKTGKAKGFADGSLGSTTALFFEPYTDAPDQYGLLSEEMQPIETMRERLALLDRAGQQLCIHAIGDRAVSLVLDLAADLQRLNGPRDRRFRIEHAQHVGVGDLDRFAALGVIASVQPYHVVDDGRWAEARLGHDRVQATFPFRSFLDRGVHLAIGTDWPVAPLDPVLTLHAAVTRATLDGRHPDGWVPGQKLGLAEAVEGYTSGAAFAEFAEADKGTITPGKLADLVLLGGDIFALPADAIRDVKVDATIVGGRVVYERR
jgi:predicted amidohydrolase YtcJ